MRFRLRRLLTDYRRFTVRTLFFVMLCVGGILAGFRAGYYGGDEQHRAETYFAKVYSVGGAIYVDAVSQEADFDSLIMALKSTVDPPSWSDVGGAGSIQVMAQKPPMVIVLQSAQNHDAINVLLTDMRTMREKGNVPH